VASIATWLHVGLRYDDAYHWLRVSRRIKRRLGTAAIEVIDGAKALLRSNCSIFLHRSPEDRRDLRAPCAALEVHLVAGETARSWQVPAARCNPGAQFSRRRAASPEESCLPTAKAKPRQTCARVLRIETSLYAVGYLLPPASVSVFTFSSPIHYRKRRHHQRRVRQQTFDFDQCADTGGLPHIATDQHDYFLTKWTSSPAPYELQDFVLGSDRRISTDDLLREAISNFRGRRFPPPDSSFGRLSLQ